MKNSCEITFEGLNVARLLSTLAKSDITLYKVERTGKRCVISVPSARAKQTIALLQEKCYNIIGIKYVGITAVAKFLRFRFVLPIFCLLTVLILVLSSHFCFKIVISGDFDNALVSEALSDIGVTIGCNMSKLDVDVLENTLANKMDAMYAVVTRSGSVLYVNVVAKKQIDDPIDMTKSRDVVATRSGVVTSVVCEQGNALVKVGDTVNVGDVLIEGKRIYNDGTFDTVYALGRVTLQISATGFAEYSGYRTETVETGNVFTCTGVSLFGKIYSKSCPFEQFTLETNSRFLYPLNLEIVSLFYREMKTVSVSATIDECLEQLQLQALEQAKLSCDFTVIDTQYITQTNGVTVTLYGEIQIE
ncbi:MAG: sporulation protein YqfD [Clostridiales bacterium]|nr:sporulation protein YqfD [Clostridiales bacterium]